MVVYTGNVIGVACLLTVGVAGLLTVGDSVVEVKFYNSILKFYFKHIFFFIGIFFFKAVGIFFFIGICLEKNYLF